MWPFGPIMPSKTPLKQASILSFFSPNSLKRPPENDGPSQTKEQAKRTKLDLSQQQDRQQQEIQKQQPTNSEVLADTINTPKKVDFFDDAKDDFNISFHDATPPSKANYKPKSPIHLTVKSQVNNDNTKKTTDTWAHLNYTFLYPPHRKDINKHKPDHPDYDENTLYVPSQFLNEQTPAMRQWWLLKQQNMNAILFFKMGKFYELFNQDAVTVVEITDIAYMKGDEDKPAHAGFPEVSFDKYANKLIERGFRILRIEQTETPAMMEERCKRTGQKSKFDKVVNREVCQALTKGTQMMSVTDTVFHTFRNQYLMSLCETNLSESSDHHKEKIIGVCFVDVTIGKFFIGQFKDDRNRSNLHTLMSHQAPVEIIYEKNGLSDATEQVIKKTNAIRTPLRLVKDYWPLRTALTHMESNSIFQNEKGEFVWPQFLKDLFEFGDESDSLIALEPEIEKQLALKSFAGLTGYLHSHFILPQVLSCAIFENYEPPQSRYDKQKSKTSEEQISAPMILDHVALKNLEVLENSSGGTECTLFHSLNYCETHFGKRLLITWICSPLCDTDQINNRLDAVQVLIDNSNQSFMSELSATLKNIPDLERLLSRIKSQSFKTGADTRAILFDNDQYSKSKINSFLTLLQTFRRLRKSIDSMRISINNSGSKTLIQLLTLTKDGGLFPDYEEAIRFFDDAFNHEEAKRTGKIIPEPGVDEDYDRCQSNINEINRQLEEYIETQRTRLRCRSIEYFGTGKNRFQLQIPERNCTNVPDDYRIETTRKGFKRYYTPLIDKLLAELMIAEEERGKALDSIMANIFGQFSRKFQLWTTAIECVAVVDVLQSLARFARSLKANGLEICRPEIIHMKNPKMTYTIGRHPSLVKKNFDFIPNDLDLDQKLVLLSGANMGGKSTIMRQTGILAILAQIGSFVPAASLRMSPVDRIFSRLGASDRIMDGESTFYTELIETSVMINHATRNSLLLLDELGRGTSTFDGTAIAHSVIEEICNNIQCRCLFSTHYHSLVEEFKNNDKIRLAHMACKVETSVDDHKDVEEDPLKENITFLHKITDGPAYRSYGFNVAKIAGIEADIIKEAIKKAKELETIHKIAEKLRSVDISSEIVGKEALKAKLLATLKNQP